MSKRIDHKTFEQFIKDVNTLKSVYTNAKIAGEMKMNSGNFSSRVNGGKRPGQDFIDRFYAVWGKKLKEIIEPEGLMEREAGASAINEPKEGYSNRSLQLSDEQDERLRRMERSISRLDSAFTIVVERLLESNQKLIDANLSILKQLAERAGIEPAAK